MARKKVKPLTKLDQIKARKNTWAGTWPGAGRNTHPFVNQKRENKKKWCRKKPTQPE